MEDHDLADAAARGDQRAFEEIVLRYRGYIYSIAHRITLNEEDALDVTQNVYLRLVEKIGEYRGAGALRAWIATIASREAISFLRGPGRREASVEPVAMESLLDARAEAEDAGSAERLDQEARMRLVEGAMAELSPQQRAILVLSLMEGMAPKQIAERLGIPNRQVSAQLSRAVAKLRERLAAAGHSLAGGGRRCESRRP